MKTPAMSVEAAVEHFNRALKFQAGREWSLFIKVHRPGAVGGTPAVPVTAVNIGFDWDAGRILLESNVQLTSLSPEDVAAIHESVKKGSSWHAYQAWEKQEQRIKELERQLAAVSQRSIT